MVKLCPWCEKINPVVKTNCKFCNCPLHICDHSIFFLNEYGLAVCQICHDQPAECDCFPCKNSTCDCINLRNCLVCEVCVESCLHYNARDNYLRYDEDKRKWVVIDLSDKDSYFYFGDDDNEYEIIL